jgi:hypothetical protein
MVDLNKVYFGMGLDYLTGHLLHGLQKKVDIVKLLMLFLLPPDMIFIKKGRVKINNYPT